MIRLFVGIDLPPDVKRRLDGICYGVDGARWVDPESFHVTLSFIGGVPEPDADTIAEALASVEVPTFELALGDVGHFGTGSKVRALWVGVAPNPGLTALQRAVASCLRRLGFKGDGKAFRPHVTIARFAEGIAGDLGKFLGANALFRVPPFPVEQFELFSSRLGRGGASYRVEAEYPLLGAGWDDAYA